MTLTQFVYVAFVLVYAVAGFGYMAVRAQETVRPMLYRHMFFFWFYMILEMFAPEEF